MKLKRLQETLPVRIPTDVDNRLKRIAIITGLSKSDVLRLSIRFGLPKLEAGQLIPTE